MDGHILELHTWEYYHWGFLSLWQVSTFRFLFAIMIERLQIIWKFLKIFIYLFKCNGSINKLRIILAGFPARIGSSLLILYQSGWITASMININQVEAFFSKRDSYFCLNSLILLNLLLIIRVHVFLFLYSVLRLGSTSLFLHFTYLEFRLRWF